jgi:hypothetical protein
LAGIKSGARRSAGFPAGLGPLRINSTLWQRGVIASAQSQSADVTSNGSDGRLVPIATKVRRSNLLRLFITSTVNLRVAEVLLRDVRNDSYGISR